MKRELPVLVASNCLLGMNVRYDGSNEFPWFISSVPAVCIFRPKMNAYSGST